MDPILAGIALVLVVRRLFVDGAYAIRGKTPPSYQVRLAKLAAKGSQAAARRPARYGSTDYVRDLWHDAWEDARAKRVAKRTGGVPAEPVAATGPAAPAVPAGPVAPPAEPGPAPAGPAPYRPTFEEGCLPNLTGGRDLHVFRRHAKPGDHCACGLQRLVGSPVAPAPKDPAPAAEPVADGGDERPLAPVTELFPHKEEDPNMTAPTTLGNGHQPPSGEVTGLASAKAYAAQMAAAYSGAASSVETFTSSLQDSGVSGEALTAAAQAQEAQEMAAAAWQRALAALSQQDTVAEAYSATPGAGSREFVTSE